MNFESEERKIVFGLAIVVLILLIVFPVVAHRCMVKHREDLNQDTMKEKYGSLYQNVRDKDSDSLRFTMYFCFRRMAFAAIIVFLKDYLMYQIMAADLSIMCILVFYVGVLPMTNKV